MSSTINLIEFLPLVRPHAPGAAIPNMTQALRKAAIEFCEKTRCWRYRVNVQVTRQDYPVVTPAYAEIHEIERAEFDGNRLTPVEYDDLTFQELSQAEAGVPHLITQMTYDQVAIVPFATGSLSLSLFLKPRHGDNMTTGTDGLPSNFYDLVPEVLYSRFGETIASGAIARLLIIPQQPFTNLDLAAVHQAKFEDGVSRFNAANVRGQHRARPRVRASWF
ncbi:hypothetical protein [Roseovarius nitratireducens]|uniref:hypothetical protein n=1 Tax=Roseovarius nitratireducens TaxID=2044597 RepID=UPI000CE27F01|nr:hypothetical protein [Roseovarius nitratireducens]